ncbi:MAG: peptidylprolyl isomerase [Patescibacteria group bacterium]|nr:peptidylprolyl isomerase [Patescibacteria group bacterium]
MEANKKIKSKKSKVISLIFLLLVALIIIFILIFAIGIYGFNWQDSFTKKVSQIVPYPSALVNYKFLSYHDFLEDKETLSYYYENMPVVETNQAKPNNREINQLSISRLIKNEFLRQEAKDYDLNVTDLELEQEMQKIINQSESKQGVEDILKEIYNWQPEDFKENVLRYYLLRSKLQDALVADENLSVNKQAKEKADEVLEKVNNEEKSFENLAKEYSEDDTASQGGYLGFFSQGEMVSEFEQAAMALEEDETSGLVKTEFGYHIIKLLSKKGEGEDLELEASHILIKTANIDTYINQEIKKARIYVFLKDIKWDKELGSASLPGVNTNTNQ